MDSRLERQARNEGLIREVNERIERVAEEARLGDELERFEFLCECGAGGDDDIACEERIEMTVAEYEEIRSQDDRFALVPGHENEELEDVIRRTDRFVVVDKKPTAEPFVDDDPRGASSNVAPVHLLRQAAGAPRRVPSAVRRSAARGEVQVARPEPFPPRPGNSYPLVR